MIVGRIHASAPDKLDRRDETRAEETIVEVEVWRGEEVRHGDLDSIRSTAINK
jgi:hypothetical protein